MARALVIYCVTDPDGAFYRPTKDAAIREARELFKANGDPQLEVQRITIPGPFNRDLACRLLASGGYASEVVTIWTPATKGD